MVKRVGTKLFAPEKNGDRMYEICEDIDVIKKIMDLQNGTMMILLKYFVSGMYKEVLIDRATFSKSGLLSVLPSRGVMITESNAGLVLDYLLYREQRIPVTYKHSQVGFVKIDGKRVFLHQKAVSEDQSIQSYYQGDLHLEQKGTLEGELKLIRECVLGTTLEFAWILGFSAPLVGYLRDLVAIDNVIVHIYGSSSTGKTSASLLCLSTFDSPSKSRGNGLFGTWMSTPNALMGRLSGNNGLPVVFDEGSLIEPRHYASILYQFASGLEKSRLSHESSLREVKRWKTSIISTSENRILTSENMAQGLRMRVLNLANIQWTNSAEHSEELTRRLQENFGNSGIFFVKHLLKLKEEDVIHRFWECRDKILESLRERDTLSNRAAHKLAIIYLAAVMGEEVFNLNLNLPKILSMLVEGEAEQMEQRDMAYMAFQHVRDYVTSNISKFIHTETSNFRQTMDVNFYDTLPKNEILGKVIKSSKGPSEIWIIRSHFDKILRLGGFLDSDVILHQLRAKGVLMCDRSKYTKKKVLYRGGDTVRVVVLRLTGHEYEKVESSESEDDSQAKGPDLRDSLPIIEIDEI